MNRRQALTAAVIAPVSLGLAGQVMAKDNTLEDKYWEAQWLIGEYEQDLQDMRNHASALKFSEAVS